MNPADTDRMMGMVEDALGSMPAAPVPAALRSRVMRRVRALSAAPKFAFPWLEAAISLMVSTLVAGMGSLLVGLPPATLQRLIQSVRLFFLLPVHRPLIAAAAAGMGMLAVCLILSARFFLPKNRAGVKFVPGHPG
jgi:signal transduction histidine kinase